MASLRQIKCYGKGRIDESTSQSILAALAGLGEKILIVGCDPKAEGTRLILNSKAPDIVFRSGGARLVRLIYNQRQIDRAFDLAEALASHDGVLNRAHQCCPSGRALEHLVPGKLDIRHQGYIKRIPAHRRGAREERGRSASRTHEGADRGRRGKRAEEAASPKQDRASQPRRRKVPCGRHCVGGDRHRDRHHVGQEIDDRRQGAQQTDHEGRQPEEG